MKKSPFKFLQNQNGSVAIEAAIVLPVMLMLYFGMLDLTKLISEHRRVTTIAGTIADLVGQHQRFITNSGATGDLADYFKVAPMVMKPKTDEKLRIRVTAYRNNAGTPEINWSVNNGRGSACTNTPSQDEILNLMGDGKDVIVAQVCTDTVLYYGHILKPFFAVQPESDFDVENFVLITPRVSDFLECYTTSGTTSGPSTCAKTG